MIRLGKEKGEVKVVSDQICTPTYTKNIAKIYIGSFKN
jgi:dTDP-4-dehydrorhamnose reductase